MPRVSVVMPVYNGERFLAEAIESILAQTFEDFEFIIVDDGSGDRSADIIADYARKDERIRIVTLPRNMGVAAAHNAGIAASSGAYIATMDCDDISLPQRLQRQVDYLKAHPAIGGVGVSADKVSEDLSHLYSFEVPLCHTLITYEMFTGQTALIRASMMVRREFLEAAGGHDPDFGSCHDFEFFLRLIWQTKIRLANIDAPLYLYRQHDASLTQSRKTWPPPATVEAKRRALKQLWGEEPGDAVARLIQARPGMRLHWRERRMVRRDLTRLIEALIAEDWVEGDDRALLYETVRRRVEGTHARWWLKCRHWYRYRIKRHLPKRAR